MSMSTLYRHAAVLAPRTPATPHEARAISRLATKAQALAGEYGEVLTRREALIRARQNLAWAHQAVLAKGIAESELVL